MSEIKVNSIKGVGSTDAAITINNSDGTCTANLSNRQGKNLIINGAMQVAQRGTSSTSSGHQTVDRFAHFGTGWDEAMTQSQSDVASGTTPYTLGFRKAFKVQNGNQTSGAGAGDAIYIRYRPEAQDIASSGWNYTSTSSFITLSFWVKSSVAQNFFGYLETSDGTQKIYPFQTGSLSADTWTKVIVKIPGHADLAFNLDNGQAMGINIAPFFGTAYTANSATVDTWKAYSDTERMPDNTSTWYTTNDATFEITGVQLEVGNATDFEHKSFGQELELCRRYYQVLVDDGSGKSFGNGTCYTDSNMHLILQLSPNMRTTPTIDQVTGTNYYRMFRNGGESTFSQFSLEPSSSSKIVDIYATGASGSQGASALLRTDNAAAKIRFSAEL